ncbi:hypothetical protein E2C01_067426 [Portunus trituberculatus]|uniref:Uncharacterized protein n=1 Tax=Portunus trituberculatus TaxID=210409 RepID=A0A5B7HWN8_PORTR|nr:hypothetical protein [Portunus trituberculatus]
MSTTITTPRTIINQLRVTYPHNYISRGACASGRLRHVGRRGSGTSVILEQATREELCRAALALSPPPYPSCICRATPPHLTHSNRGPALTHPLHPCFIRAITLGYPLVRPRHGDCGCSECMWRQEPDTPEHERHAILNAPLYRACCSATRRKPRKEASVPETFPQCTRGQPPPPVAGISR